MEYDIDEVIGGLFKFVRITLGQPQHGQLDEAEQRERRVQRFTRAQTVVPLPGPHQGAYAVLECPVTLRDVLPVIGLESPDLAEDGEVRLATQNDLPPGVEIAPDEAGQTIRTGARSRLGSIEHGSNSGTAFEVTLIDQVVFRANIVVEAGLVQLQCIGDVAQARRARPVDIEQARGFGKYGAALLLALELAAEGRTCVQPVHGGDLRCTPASVRPDGSRVANKDLPSCCESMLSYHTQSLKKYPKNTPRAFRRRR